METTEEPILNKELHIKYWKRCLQTLLPNQYTSTDSSRMTFGFFILSALDLLGCGVSTFPRSQRTNLQNWILKCQDPNGGFCGSPNHKFPEDYYKDVGQGEGKQEMDAANLPATFFAMLALGLVGSFERLKRRECLRWLRRLQREDGSFGELVTKDGVIGGGRDMRYCLVATAVRWMLRGDIEGDRQRDEEEDIDVEKLVRYIHAGQTYDGGVSESSQHESHAGYTYCAVASLSLLGRLSPEHTIKGSNVSTSSLDIPAILRWLVTRQKEYIEPNQSEDEIPNHDDKQTGATDLPALEQLSIHDSDLIGFNGRCNKHADTCYSFWVAASLDIIGHHSLLEPKPIRRFLLQKTQHRIGGFGKYPTDPPDIYHSYLALAALSVVGEPGLKKLDSALCISIEAKQNLEKLRREALVPRRRYWLHGCPFEIRGDDPEFKEKMARDEGPPKELAEALKVEVGGGER